MLPLEMIFFESGVLKRELWPVQMFPRGKCVIFDGGVTIFISDPFGIWPVAVWYTFNKSKNRKFALEGDARSERDRFIDTLLQRIGQ